MRTIRESSAMRRVVGATLHGERVRATVTGVDGDRVDAPSIVRTAQALLSCAPVPSNPR
jgi:hypothetical protein